jgi:DNA-binding transcriptional ArsR family regulator
MQIDAMAERLSALGNKTRLGLYRLLVRAGDAGMTVGQLQEKLEIPASTLSHHCRALVQVDLVRQERVGTSLVCRTNYPVMRALVDGLAAECCADANCSNGA